MSELIEKLKTVNKVKDEVIIRIKGIPTEAISKTQAQNLREYATQTGSIEEILLYIDYQRARNLKSEKVKDHKKKKENQEYNRILNQSSDDLKSFINQYNEKFPAAKDVVLEVVRYSLGIFARHVMIQDKKRRGEGA